MKERILEIYQRQCGIIITEDKELIQSRIIESYQLMNVIVDLEEEFGIKFTPDEIGNLDYFKTVNDVERLVIDKINEKGGLHG